MEADFDATHKTILNNRLILSIENADAIPVEVVGGRRSQAATHLALNKNLIANIANICKLPMVTICTDVIISYDRVAHLFASLRAQWSLKLHT